jgi:hypothetical protein
MLSATMRFAPEKPPAMVVLTREGVPLIATNDHRKEQIAKAMSELAGMLDLMRPEDPQSWKDRLYYLRAIQPAAYQAGQCAPLLVGDPLDRAALRERSVFQFDATLNVSADGIVTGVAIKPGGRIPAELVESVAYALEKAVLVPAVAKGRFVDGVYEYHFEAPR